MPELPEVETITLALKIILQDKLINKVTAISNLKLRKIVPLQLYQIKNLQIIDISRRAKFIQIMLSGNHVIIIHLGMSGKLLIKDGNYIYQKHDHVTFELSEQIQLVYNDPRRFGLVDYIAEKQLVDYFKNFGPEPFSDEFNVDYIANYFSKSSQGIKKVIMDNKFVVGVGNIYACESLFLSNIHPEKPANQLSKKDIISLRDNILIVLKKAIAKGGSSLRDYTSISGEKGYFQKEFYVYAREGQNCLICKNELKRIVQAGRSSFFCPKCQKI